MRLAKREYCTGCAACEYVCGCSAIKLRPDKEGFLRPCIDEGLCVSCGKCTNTCPVLNKSQTWTPLRCSAVFVKDEVVRRKSASGGVFAELSRAVLSCGGLVVGSAFTPDLAVKHIIISDVDDIYRLQGSKYVQSELGDVYCKMRVAFDHGKTVLFSGTPCQVAAARLVFRKEKRLLTAEVACHGVPPPVLFSRYLRELESCSQEGAIKSFSFKDKSESWSRYSVSWKFANDKNGFCVAGDSAYLLAFSQNLCLRPSCANCQAKEGQSGSDITLSDFWGISDVAPELNDDKGISAVIINTEKGLSLFSQIEDSCYVHDVNLDQIVAKNPFLIKSVDVDESARSRFMEEYSKKGIAAAYKLALARPILSRLYRAFCIRLSHFLWKI